MFLCPYNWIDFPKAKDLNISLEALKFGLSHIFSQSKGEYLTYDYENDKGKNDFLAYIKQNHIEDYREFFHLISKSTKDVGELLTLKKPVPINATKLFLYSQIGYLLQVDPMHCSTEATYSRPKFKLFFTEDEYLEHEYLNLSTENYHTLLFYPDLYATVGFNRIILDKDKEYVLKIFPKKFVAKDSIRKPCIDKRTHPKYSSRLCVMDCIERKLNLKHKNCMHLGLFNYTKSDAGTPYCTSMTVYTDHDDRLIKTYTDQCTLNCLQKCEHYLPEFLISSADIRLKAENNLSTVSYSTVEILYDVCNQGVMVITEYERLSFEGLIADVGGILGLWLGASAITFIQIIMFVLEAIMTKCTERSNSKKMLK